jgi:hypothetical protein
MDEDPYYEPDYEGMVEEAAQESRELTERLGGWF